MNQQTQRPISGTSINSKHYINQLESTIIQIAKCLSVEKAVPVDPDSKEMTRQIVQEKLNTLLSDAQIEEIHKANKELMDLLKYKGVMSETASRLMKTLTIMGLDNV